MIYSKKEEAVQGISQVQYEGNINTDSSFEDNIAQESKEVKSEHDTDYSNRALLANAFESIPNGSEAYMLIQRYKGHITELNSLENRLNEMNAGIHKLRFNTFSSK